MDTLALVLLAVLFSAVIAVISSITMIRQWWGSNAESKRRAHVAELAGLEYRWMTPFTKDPAWSGGVLGKGHDKTARDVIYGRYKGRPVVCFEYRWVQKTDDQEQVFSRMVGAAWIGGNLPRISVSGEGPVKDLPGDILVESHEFNQRFRLTSPDREAAIHLMEPRMIEYLVSLGSRAPEFWLENGWVLMHAPVVKGEGSGDQLHRLLNQPTGIASRVPEWLLKDYGGGMVDPSVRDPQASVEVMLPFVKNAMPYPRRESFLSVIGRAFGKFLSSSTRNAGDVFTSWP